MWYYEVIILWLQARVTLMLSFMEKFHQEFSTYPIFLSGIKLENVETMAQFDDFYLSKYSRFLVDLATYTM